MEYIPGLILLHISPGWGAPESQECGEHDGRPAQPDSPRRVYTDIQQVLSHLTHPRFTFTQSEADADILYNFSHFKDYR